MGDALCVCGHVQFDHIYEEGACRPGFVCPSACARFTAAIAGQLTIDDIGDVIPSRNTDPATSHAAAAEIKIRANSQRALLLQAFSLHYRSRLSGEYRGLTDEEAMEWAEGVSPTSEYAKRCSELREGGFIEPTGETRAGSAGPQRIVSKITDKGRAWIEANR